MDSYLYQKFCCGMQICGHMLLKKSKVQLAISILLNMALLEQDRFKYV